MTPLTSNREIFKTRDLYLVSFLLFRGMEMVGREIENGKGVFSFEDTSELQRLCREYYGPGCEARRLFETFRSVKDYLFDRR